MSCRDKYAAAIANRPAAVRNQSGRDRTMQRDQECREVYGEHVRAPSVIRWKLHQPADLPDPTTPTEYNNSAQTLAAHTSASN